MVLITTLTLREDNGLGGRVRGAMGEGEQLGGQVKDPPAFIHRNVMARKGHSKVRLEAYS